MKALLDWFNGKKTYIVGAVLVVVAGLYARGLIDETTYKWLEGLLLGTGVITLRAGVTKSAEPPKTSKG